MKYVNKVILLGNATHDAELRTTPAGQSVCAFGLATDRVWKDTKGEQAKLTEFHHVVTWGSLAEICSQSVKKGKSLYIEGYLKTTNWESKAKQKMTRTEIVADEVVFLATSAPVEA